MRVAHQRVQIKRTEGDSFGGRLPLREMQAQHDHACIPEEQDVVAADEQDGGIKCPQVRRIVRPAERREGPEARAEPRIQHVRVLFEPSAAALSAFFGRAGGLGSAINDSHSRIARGRDATARAVPDRNAMAPPELTRDAPIADIGQPIGENFALIIGNDLDLSFLDCCYGRISQGSHFAKPLRRDARLDHGLASIANTYREGVILYFDEQAL